MEKHRLFSKMKLDPNAVILSRESIRANPLDGVVLLVGCDKTTPALLMGAASCDLPTMVISGGPMLNPVSKLHQFLLRDGIDSFG